MTAAPPLSFNVWQDTANADGSVHHCEDSVVAVTMPACQSQYPSLPCPPRDLRTLCQMRKDDGW